MGLYRPSHLQEYLKQLETKAKKGLSQNFLIDGNILTKILAIAHVQTGDHIIEIGPGPGVLTEALLQRGAKVLAIEADPIFAKALPTYLKGGERRLHVVHADALKVEWESLLKEINRPGKVVANLPYQITSPLLANLLPLSKNISSLTLMVQKEVAERLVAAPGTKEYGRLSILTQFYSLPTFCFTVSAHCFTPQPKVTSAIVHLVLKPPPPVSNHIAFFHMIRLAFGQRRKMLRASLGRHFGKQAITQSLLTLSLKETSRPEDLSLENLIKLFETLSQYEKRPP